MELFHPVSGTQASSFAPVAAGDGSGEVFRGLLYPCARKRERERQREIIYMHLVRRDKEAGAMKTDRGQCRVVAVYAASLVNQ